MYSSIPCTFKSEQIKFQLRKSLVVVNQHFTAEKVEFQFNNKPIRRDDGNTTALCLKDCPIKVWPQFDPIVAILPNLQSISIRNAGLTKLEAFNLKGLYNLKELLITGNKIMCLPADLFLNTPNLEIISLKRNGIKYIDGDILDVLQNLKYCDLSENVNINALYDGIKVHNVLGLVGFKAEIKNKCSIRVADMMREISTAGFSGRRGSASEADGRKIIAQQKVIDDLKAQVREWMNNCTDFVITVDGNDFKVHKSVITEASPLLKKMIEKIPDAENMFLEDISVPTFKIIKDFMYDKKLPATTANYELYSACHKLQMNILMNQARLNIKRTVNKENAYDIIMLANKYEDSELRAAAFKEFRKNFPNKKLSDDIAKQPEALKKIMQAKIAMDEALAALEMSESVTSSFNNLNINL